VIVLEVVFKCSLVCRVALGVLGIVGIGNFFNPEIHAMIIVNISIAPSPWNLNPSVSRAKVV
jgi:hypothetical protein